MSSNVFLFTATALSVSLGAAAARAEEPVNPLDQVVVTATRTEQAVGVTGTSVSVVTAEDIRIAQKVLLSDVLRETPGVTVTRNGGPGGLTSMFIRGVSGDQAVVLVDGVRINDPSSTAGAANLQDLVTTGVERVEILRGPQSTLYGSHAMGGVVNIITNSGKPGFRADGFAEGGSFDSWRAGGTVSGGTERVQASITGSFYDTDGVSAADKDDGNTEKDGYRNWGVLGSLGVLVTDGVRVDLKSLYSRSRNEFDGFGMNGFADTEEYGRSELFSNYAGVTVEALDGKFINRLATGYSRTERGNFDKTLTPSKTFDARGEALRFEYQGIVRPAEKTELTFGAETERSEIYSKSSWDLTALKRNVDIHSVYGQAQTTLFDRLTLTGGIRYDDHDTFGGHTTVRVAGAYRVETTDTLLHANWGEGFKAPTLYQLYSAYGNETLDPETSKGWEAGINQGFLEGKIRVSATYFNQKIKNQIDFTYCTSGDPLCASGRFGYYDNVARASFRGIELGLLLQPVDALTVKANYTHLRPKNELTDEDLQRRARDSFQASVTWEPVQRLNLSGSVTLTGDSYSTAGELNPLEGYTLVDLRASYGVTENLEVYGRVENVFDTDYETVSGYGSLGRGVFVGLRASY